MRRPPSSRFSAALLMGTALTLLNPAYSLACATSLKAKPKAAAWSTYWKKRVAAADKRNRKLSSDDRLPAVGNEPWGGGRDAAWAAEAIHANAVSDLINRGFADPSVTEVLAALPVTMEYSGARPYGDGQTNAALSFGNWPHKQPPLVASLITYRDGGRRLVVKLHRSFALEGKSLQLLLGANGAKDATVPAESRDEQGDYIYSWKVPAEVRWGGLFENRVTFVKPEGWHDAFPLDFRDVVKPGAELLALIPESRRSLGKGTLLDPEKVSVQGRGDEAYAFRLMGDPRFGAGINGDRYFPVPGSGIHNEFPAGSGPRITAVGRGNTLVMEKAPAPFKLAYICFEARNLAAESKYGVPSGGGWHEIGDPAETVFNSLEKAPVLFGYANGRPAEPPAGAGFAYGLADVAVVRKLRPGDALISGAGPTTLGEDRSGWDQRGKRGPGGRNYHWFAFHHPHDVCAVEWVHPAVPSADNNLGLPRN